MAKAKIDVRLIVGSYERLGGDGIRSLTIGPTGLLAGPVLSRATDCSHAIWSPRHRRLYAVVEQQDGLVRALAAREDELFLDGEAATGGAAPCHIALDPAERFIIAANYESGSIAVFDLQGGRLPAGPTRHYQFAGSGPDADRQTGPHAHWAGFGPDPTRCYCVDLGRDIIVSLDVTSPAPAAPAYHAPAGWGPRHLAFHPMHPIAFLISELASTLTMLSVRPDGTLAAIRAHSTLPEGVTNSLGGHIVVNAAGDRAYVTNRGHDSIAVFVVDGDQARVVQWVASGGTSPRFLLLLEPEGRLLVANEESGTVHLFLVGDDGELAPIGPAANVLGAVFLARSPLPCDVSPS